MLTLQVYAMWSQFSLHSIQLHFHHSFAIKFMAAVNPTNKKKTTLFQNITRITIFDTGNLTNKQPYLSIWGTWMHILHVQNVCQDSDCIISIVNLSC